MKLTGFKTIEKTIKSVFENPDIKPEDRRKVIAELLEPMTQKLFGNDYDPYISKKDTGK
jgi:F0F1-type ATP synthase delta subunit|tara:strand:+ start:726 stop:902 length:177 start_codon:yes stop_codon:yes gene_type:complete